MTQRETLKEQQVKLYGIRNWLNYEVGSEGDRATRDAIFFAVQSVQVALLYLNEVSYRRETFTEENE